MVNPPRFLVRSEVHSGVASQQEGKLRVCNYSQLNGAAKWWLRFFVGKYICGEEPKMSLPYFSELSMYVGSLAYLELRDIHPVLQVDGTSLWCYLLNCLPTDGIPAVSFRSILIRPTRIPRGAVWLCTFLTSL